MKTELFLKHLKNTTKIQHLETVQLKEVVDKYPYFQSARALYLKGLKNVDSFKYNNELKQTAAYTTDRSVLFHYITSTDFSIKKEKIHQEISNKISDEHQPKKSIKIQKELTMGAPLSFSKDESFSFNEWLQISVKKPIERKKIIPEKKISEKETIIDRFIKKNPKIEPVAKDKSVNVTIPDNKQDEALMTETLAKVYLEQKKYDNAIQAFRILSLKYPEKSGFFADQIKRVEILQKNKL
ncbi:hypothetical protein N9V96_02255 [Polaribacter sp.]|nr:hypothetical protein [Polaribacter sp.]